MILIRAASVEDADGIARVHIAVWLSTYRGLMPDAVLQRQTVAERRAMWESLLREPKRGQILVAEAANEMLGFASFGPERDGDPVYHSEVYAIYLLQAHQRKGIGSLLLREAAACLLEQGWTTMLLWVLSANPARFFYEKLGGQHVRDRGIEISAALLQESAYGWLDLHRLLDPP